MNIEPTPNVSVTSPTSVINHVIASDAPFIGETQESLATLPYEALLPYLLLPMAGAY